MQPSSETFLPFKQSVMLYIIYTKGGKGYASMKYNASMNTTNKYLRVNIRSQAKNICFKCCQLHTDFAHRFGYFLNFFLYLNMTYICYWLILICTLFYRIYTLEMLNLLLTFICCFIQLFSEESSIFAKYPPISLHFLLKNNILWNVVHTVSLTWID